MIHWLLRDWDKAKFFAADLGHYVGDGHMPLHITRNYDGKDTGNDGIHGRFESEMINQFINTIHISKTEIDDIEVVEDYIFNYLYKNHVYVDSIMEADDYGKSVNSNTYSTEYLNAMWDFSEEFTIKILNAATKAFSSIFYAAWDEAGRPLLSTTSIDLEENSKYSELSCYPNPANSQTNIKFYSEINQEYKLSLLNLNGTVLKKISDKNLSDNYVEIVWDLNYFEPGLYLISLQNQQQNIAKKLWIN